ncbi:galactose mutarotase-like domain-containing protein [Aspergillus coremiiformis]|uniref:Galactose mutarotase-like domain-containing protein n=1 Tax=Aspergillus coremiiformis TaxID=138285 RepID=A0A5N6YS47_9EURO|nr:galactose mutarotase-like domain-containing protein [Aspergillus coremiiformis]
MVDNSSVKLTSLGAIIQELNVDGQNIVLGFTKREFYEKYNTPWFGATIGRVANRIKDGRIRSLNDKEYEIEKNNDPNALHGGSRGWGRQDFEGPTLLQRNGKDTLLYTYTSPHLDGGYPGTVEIKVFYTASKENNCSILTIEYEAQLVGSECNETVVNVTNHSYFNLTGGETVDGTSAKLSTQYYLPLDNTGIPFGGIEEHTSKVTEKFMIGPNKEAFDDVFVMDRDVTGIPLDTRERPLQLLAEFHHPESRINLQVHSTEPAFQFYTGQGTNVPAIDGNPSRGPFSGFCIEPSRFVNAINEPAWRHMVILKKGDKYGSKIVYKTWKDPM